MCSRILIVEDEGIIALDLKSRLRTLGYNVIGVVPSGEAAIKTASEYKPDLILMDILLKGEMTGIFAAKKILQKQNIPVIFITAYCDPDTIKETNKISPYGHLTKPFNENELKNKIQDILKGGSKSRNKYAPAN